MKSRNFGHEPIGSCTVGRRTLLRSAAAITGAGLFGLGSARADEADFGWTSAQIDWKRAKGKHLMLGVEQHPWSSAIKPLLPAFTRLTGITVEMQPQSETEYTAQLPVKLGASSPTPDVFMVWAIGQAIGAGWLESLDGMMADRNLLDLAWWDADDIFPSARAFQRWSDGKQYLMPVTAESQVLFMNGPALAAKGLHPPGSMDELLATAKALKTADMAGIALRAKSSGDSTWPVGGFIFGYGGAIIGLDGQVALDQPEAVEAVDMYGRLLREAGPIGVSSYQWAECLNDFMSGAVAIGCDSSNFATDIADSDKSTVAGKALYATMPKAGNHQAKPNPWHWTIGINARSENKEAAFLFLVWVNSKATAMLAAAGGLATARQSAWASAPFRRRFGDAAADAAIADLRSADGALFKATWFNPKAPQILDALAIAVNQTVTGTGDARTSLNAAATTIRRALG